MKTLLLAAWTSAFLAGAWDSSAQTLPELIADRAAIERVYHSHRTGAKIPFEQALPTGQLRVLVEQDLKKETVLRSVYGVEITPAIVAGEVQRINSTTRAPEMLAELKAALGNDPVRFARTVARPIVVEQLLRSRFESDDALHAPQRREAERVREQLLAAKTKGASVTSLLAGLRQSHQDSVSEITWQLAARPAETNAPSADEREIKQRFGPDARILSPACGTSSERKFYFDDLPAELQRVLRVQLRQAGAVSAVVEMPGGFAVYLARERTAAVLSVTAWSLPKRSYEQWLAEQPQTKP